MVYIENRVYSRLTKYHIENGDLVKFAKNQNEMFLNCVKIMRYLVNDFLPQKLILS